MKNLNTNVLVKNVLVESLTINNKLKRCCSVCGMVEWCGSDGCPMDPQ